MQKTYNIGSVIETNGTGRLSYIQASVSSFDVPINSEIVYPGTITAYGNYTIANGVSRQSTEDITDKINFYGNTISTDTIGTYRKTIYYRYGERNNPYQVLTVNIVPPQTGGNTIWEGQLSITNDGTERTIKIPTKTGTSNFTKLRITFSFNNSSDVPDTLRYYNLSTSKGDSTTETVSPIEIDSSSYRLISERVGTEALIGLTYYNREFYLSNSYSTIMPYTLGLTITKIEQYIE